jgi:hypothetical protein
MVEVLKADTQNEPCLETATEPLAIFVGRNLNISCQACRRPLASAAANGFRYFTTEGRGLAVEAVILIAAVFERNRLNVPDCGKCIVLTRC